MMKAHQGKHSIWIKTIAMVVVCLFLVNDISWAQSSAHIAQKNTLATPTEIPDPEFREKFKAMEFLLAHDVVNGYIKIQIEKEKTILSKDWEKQKTRTIDLNNLRMRGRIKYAVKGLESVMLVSVTGLLSHTGQFARVGLSGKDYGGVPVIYIDSQFFNDSRNIILKHDIDEILQWESLRVNILRIEDKAGMRQWIKEHINSTDERLNDTEFEGKNARQIAKIFHNQSYSLSSLYKNYADKIDFDYEYITLMLSLYGLDEESKDVNIAAHHEEKKIYSETNLYSSYLQQLKKAEISQSHFNELRVFVDDWYFDRLLELEACARPFVGDISIFSVKDVDRLLDHPQGDSIMPAAETDAYRKELHVLDFIRRLDPDTDKILIGILYATYEVRMRETGNRAQRFNRVDFDTLIVNWRNLLNTYIEYYIFLTVADEFGRKGPVKGQLMNIEKEVVRRLAVLRQHGDPFVIEEELAKASVHKGQEKPARYYRWIKGTMPQVIQMVITPRNIRRSDVTRNELRELIRQRVIALYGDTHDKLQRVVNIINKDIDEKLKQKLLLHRVDLRQMIIEAFPDLIIDRYSIGRPRRLARWMFEGKDLQRWDRPLDQLRALEALVEFFNPAYKDRIEELVRKGVIDRKELPGSEELISNPSQLGLKHIIRTKRNIGAERRPYIPGIVALYTDIFKTDVQRMVDDTFGPGTYSGKPGTYEYRRRYMNDKLKTLRAAGEAWSPLDLKVQKHFPFSAADPVPFAKTAEKGGALLTDAMGEIWGGVPLRLLGEDRFAKETTFRPFMSGSPYTYRDSILNRVDIVRALITKYEETENKHLTKADILEVLTEGYLSSSNNAINRSLSGALLNAANNCDKERLSKDKSLQDKDKKQVNVVHSKLPRRIKLFIEAGLLDERDYSLLQQHAIKTRDLESFKFTEEEYKRYVEYIQSQFWKEWLEQKNTPVQLPDTTKFKLQTKEKVISKLEEYHDALRVRLLIDNKRIDDIPRQYKYREIISNEQGIPTSIAFHGLYSGFYKDFSYFNVGDYIAIGFSDGRIIEWAKFRIEGIYDDTVMVSTENVEIDKRKQLDAAIPKRGALKIIPDPDVTIKVQVDVLSGLIDRIKKYGTTGNKAIDQVLGLSAPRQVTFDDIERWVAILKTKGVLNDPRIAEDSAQLIALATTLISGNVITCVSGPPGNGKSTILSERAILSARDGKTIWSTTVNHSAVDNLMENIADATGSQHTTLYRAASRPDLIRREDIRKCWLSANQEPDSRGGAVFGSTIIGSKTLASMRQRLFPLISVDEASTVTFPQLLVALSNLDTTAEGANVLIVGDDNQLPPFPINPTSVELFIKMSVRPKVTRRIEEIFKDDKKIPANLPDIMQEEFPYLDKNEVRFLCNRAKYSPDPASFLTEHIIECAHLYYNQLFNTGIIRLMMDGSFAHISLPKNYRSHWVLRELYSRLFYNGQVRSQHYSPVEEDTYVIRDTSQMTDEVARQENDAGVGDYTNEYEAKLVAKEIVRILSLRDNGSGQKRYSLRDIVVVAPYQSQATVLRRAIKRALSNMGDSLSISGQDINHFITWNVSTIDSFQGSQSKVVICSFTRSNRFPHNVGFLNEFRRINVTISRVREKLILIGDFKTLTQARRKQEDAIARNMFSIMHSYASEVKEWYRLSTSDGDKTIRRPKYRGSFDDKLKKTYRKGSPIKFLRTLIKHPDLLKKACTEGFSIKEIAAFRKEDDSAASSTAYSEFEELKELGVLIKVEGYHKQVNPRYRLADNFIGEDEAQTVRLINSLIENKTIPAADGADLIGRLYTSYWTQDASTIALNILAKKSEFGDTLEIFWIDENGRERPLYDKYGRAIRPLKISDLIETRTKSIMQNIRDEAQGNLEGIDKDIATLIIGSLGNKKLYLLEHNFAGIKGISGGENEVYLGPMVIASTGGYIGLFHEIGESIKGRIEKMLKDEGFHNLNVHAYLRGCGRSVRTLVKDKKFSDAEELIAFIKDKLDWRRYNEAEIELIRYNASHNRPVAELVYGLQDRIFGQEANDEFSEDMTQPWPHSGFEPIITANPEPGEDEIITVEDEKKGPKRIGAGAFLQREVKELVALHLNEMQELSEDEEGLGVSEFKKSRVPYGFSYEVSEAGDIIRSNINQDGDVVGNTDTYQHMNRLTISVLAKKLFQAMDIKDEKPGKVMTRYGRLLVDVNGNIIDFEADVHDTTLSDLHAQVRPLVSDTTTPVLAMLEFSGPELKDLRNIVVRVPEEGIRFAGYTTPELADHIQRQLESLLQSENRRLNDVDMLQNVAPDPNEVIPRDSSAVTTSSDGRDNYTVWQDIIGNLHVLRETYGIGLGNQRIFRYFNHSVFDEKGGISQIRWLNGFFEFYLFRKDIPSGVIKGDLVESLEDIDQLPTEVRPTVLEFYRMVRTKDFGQMEGWYERSDLDLNFRSLDDFISRDTRDYREHAAEDLNALRSWEKDHKEKLIQNEGLRKHLGRVKRKIREALKTEKKLPRKPSIVKTSQDLDDRSNDIEKALCVMNTIIPVELEKGRIYEIRYDSARLREYQRNAGISEEFSPEALLKAYIQCLQMRVSCKDPEEAKEMIKLIECPTRGSVEQNLISVTCYGDKSKTQVIGESHVNIKGNLQGQVLRIVGMLNMALTASNIPNGISSSQLNEYNHLINLIQSQYKEITGKELSSEELLQAIRLIELPDATPIPISNIEEYYRLTIKQLQQAA